MAETLGALLKKARTEAGLTQAELAKRVGLTASELSKAERELQGLPADSLKKIAKETGVPQKVLLQAAKALPQSEGEEALTTAEKTLLKYYRKADGDARSDALKILKGEKTDVELLLTSLLGESKYEKLMKKVKK